MAANDYYASGQAQHPAHSLHSDTPPLHSPPSLSPAHSRVASPFDDRNRFDYPSNTNLVHTQTGYSSNYSDDTAYHGAAATPPPSYHNPPSYHHDTSYDPPNHASSDPFADQNAIPLRNQNGKMGDGEGSEGVYVADPERYPPGMKKKKKKGMFAGKVTWVVYLLTAVQVAVFIGELAKNAILTGTPIQTKPTFNIMIGPSPYVLINMGARYPPCMHYIEKIVDNKVTDWLCPNTTSLDAKSVCSLNEVCGLGGVPKQVYDFTFDQRGEHKAMEPDQWYRFITPIFLHAGLIHIGFNMLLQWTLGRDMEKEIGSLRFALVYFSAGIFGFVLGGNYAAEGITSVGASGSLFGILALVLLDLLYNWSSRRSPMKDLLFLMLDFAISFVLGLLPGLDNFSHIGGFLMGIVLGVCLLHSPQALRERTGALDPPYATVDNPAIPAMSGANGAGSGGPAMKAGAFVKSPLDFFKGRKPFWWVFWLVRAAMLVVTLIGFILLLRNFYDWRNGCSWCHHLTCLPIKTNNVSWCDIGSLNVTSTSSSPSSSSSSPAKLLKL
ncbi:rhomboid-domain-containing protein [Massarina eburnea CBS 473.64]|uniref:Rhomboid-type serine protease n=1 Tax=Massarina eburnea CBS 473.64 TaxID=1395130 RepID=A0A6A6SBM4_9PLEO|nr:rhomboid-domain-containing protein [Massarina eburnea CBS 473.64]